MPRDIIALGDRLGEENGDPQPGERYQLRDRIYVVVATTDEAVIVRVDHEAEAREAARRREQHDAMARELNPPGWDLIP